MKSYICTEHDLNKTALRVIEHRNYSINISNNLLDFSFDENKKPDNTKFETTIFEGLFVNKEYIIL